MAKLIALEWDAREARIAVANPRGSDLIVEEAFAVDLASSSSTEALSDREVGKRLTAVFAERGLSGSDVLVGLSRSSIELRTLTLPLVPPAEIPDMVRFQAMQAFTSIGEDWPLDYVELEGHEDSLSVLAAVVSPKEVQQIQEACAAAQVKTRCLVLRPFAAVSLLQRSGSIDLQRGSLIVDLLPEGADLTAVSHSQVVFMRSVRLPSHTDAQAQARALVGELRRTIGAAQNQMGGGQIEQIAICGAAEEHAVLYQTVSQSLPQEVIAFDPFAAVRVAKQLQAKLPENSGRYAPLLGMLTCEFAGTRHTIDFLNPRKRPKPPSNSRRNLAIAAAVLVVVGAGTSLFMWHTSNLDARIAELTEQSLALTTAVNKAKVLVEKVNTVKKFAEGDITWLDEIREVAHRLPDADHVILDEVTLGADLDRGGRLKLVGHVVQPDVIAELEESLRDGDNLVTGRIGIVDRKRKDYPYQLETTVLVPPDVQKDGHSVGRPPITQSSTAAETEKSERDTQASPPQKAPSAPKTKPAIEQPPASPAEASPAAAAATTVDAAEPEESEEDTQASPPQNVPSAPEAKPALDQPPESPAEESPAEAAETTADAAETEDTGTVPPSREDQPPATGVPPGNTEPAPQPKPAESSTPVDPSTEKPQETQQAGSQTS